MKTSYRVHEFYYNRVKFDLHSIRFFTAQYKPWYFPFVWFDCYGYNTCCYKETADEVCRLHRKGVSFNEGALDWTINHLDLEIDDLAT